MEWTEKEHLKDLFQDTWRISKIFYPLGLTFLQRN